MVAIALAYTLDSGLGGDYQDPNCPRSPICDDPGQSIDALLDGDLGRFFRDQPVAGPVSILLRAPAAGLARTTGSGLLGEYRAGSFVCLLACVVLGAALFLILRRQGAPLWLQLVAAAGTLVNPTTKSALFWGHPEDFVAAALTAGALLLVIAGRPRLGAAALAFAVATKLWALLPALVLLALVPAAERKRVAVIGVAVAGLLIAPMAVGSPAGFHDALAGLGRIGSEPGTLSQASAWWPFGHETAFQQIHEVGGTLVVAQDEGWAMSRTLARIAHPLILVLALGLSALWWARFDEPRRRQTALGLVALIFLLRAPLDPNNHSYYHLPFLLSLLAWEVVSLRRPPFATAAAAVGLHVVGRALGGLGDGGFNAIYLGGCAAFVAYLCVAVFGGWGTVRPRWNSSGST